ncbi:polysaccharide deacetylase family protein [Desulfatirhabdium butyrativorans]|uniref:polysaccharide deacetylase family protein n=1 Tax=Desulfatirhabdium butyrativorans TaxID=340467 RepID=UPI000407A17B|nr:polysaccharide deacetylase family protein [Desulfatirhabdium butyrativorans]
MKSTNQPFVFLDNQGKRWHRLRIALIAATIVILTASVVFVQSLLVPPVFPVSKSFLQLKARLHALETRNDLPSTVSLKAKWMAFSRTASASPLFRSTEAMPPRLKLRKTTRPPRVGFVEEGFPAALVSLQNHAKSLTHVCTEWMSLVDTHAGLSVLPNPKVIEIARKNNLKVVLLLNNMLGNKWQTDAVEWLASASDAVQDRFIGDILLNLKYVDADGLLIEWGEIDSQYRQGITRLILKIAHALRDANIETWLRVPMGPDLRAYDLDALCEDVDYFVAALHDEFTETDEAGPVASQPWFDGWLETMMDYGEPSQWIIEIGTYGYDWEKGAREARTKAFTDIMACAGQSGIETIESRGPGYNPHFDYTDEGVEHSVWFLDVATFANQLQSIRRHHVSGIGIYSLGYEDPAVWKILDNPNAAVSPEECQPMQAAGRVAHFGNGCVLTVEDGSENGQRAIHLDADGKFVETYTVLPSYVTVVHQGSGKEDEVSLTFDDGPDPAYTPKILDILKQHNVKAAFFVIGANAEKYPEIISRMVAEGHEVGNHTFTHPNLARISGERAVLELNATQRLIESITGRSTIWFRPPYAADALPTSPEDIATLRIAQDLGYLTVMHDIDPEDWSRPGIDEIIRRIQNGRLLGGNIVLLHDGGGNRRQTVEALPAILDYFDKRADRVVGLSALLGLSPDQAMPHVVASRQSLSRIVSGGGLKVFYGIERSLWSFLVVSTGLVLLRTLFILVLAIRNRRRKSAGKPFHPAVSVLLAAYNEARVIGPTIRSVLDTDYPADIELIVVDDGSADDTAAIVASLAATDPRIRLIRQPNRGKAEALKLGMQHTSHEIVVMLDADTCFRRDTLGHLIQPLGDPAVGAVCGHARIGNLRTMVARFQAIEYACGFNLDRQAFDEINGITVVPGAINAVRKAALLRSGGISADTLAEDTDFTLAMHRLGYRIVYAPRAIAYTEAPETLAALGKQRFRWAFGTLQCLWKHRDMTFNPRYKALGCLSLPNVWFFHILLIAVSPIVDLMLLLGVLLGISGFPMLVYFSAFLLCEMLTAALALRLEGAPWRHLLLVPIMRLVYRPLLGWVMWKSLAKALKGVWVGWGKLERTGAVSLS